MNQKLKIRQASVDDVPTLLNFIHKIAEYEKLSHEVVATEATLTDSLFGENSHVEAVLCYEQEEPVAFAIFFHNFSTFTGRYGLYLEDLFVLPEMRGKSYGKQILSYLAKLAVQRNCARFEWFVLDWNESAIQFYQSLGAKPMQGWTVYRLDGQALLDLAADDK